MPVVSVPEAGPKAAPLCMDPTGPHGDPGEVRDDLLLGGPPASLPSLPDPPALRAGGHRPPWAGGSARSSAASHPPPLQCPSWNSERSPRGRRPTTGSARPPPEASAPGRPPAPTPRRGACGSAAPGPTAGGPHARTTPPRHRYCRPPAPSDPWFAILGRGCRGGGAAGARPGATRRAPSGVRRHVLRGRKINAHQRESDARRQGHVVWPSNSSPSRPRSAASAISTPRTNRRSRPRRTPMSRAIDAWDAFDEAALDASLKEYETIVDQFISKAGKDVF